MIPPEELYHRTVRGCTETASAPREQKGAGPKALVPPICPVHKKPMDTVKKGGPEGGIPTSATNQPPLVDANNVPTSFKSILYW